MILARHVHYPPFLALYTFFGPRYHCFRHLYLSTALSVYRLICIAPSLSLLANFLAERWQ